MKKNIRLVAAVATLLIAAAGVITFEACNKKNEVVNNIPELNVAELSDMDKEMILFGEKLKSAAKGGETMQLDEAVRNLSNYQNFKMCDASRYSADMERLTIESEIPVTDGNVYLSDINAIYESNRKQIKDKLASLEGDDKAVYSVYSRIDGNSKDGDGAKVVTDAILFSGDGAIIPSPYYFDENICWQGIFGFCESCTGGYSVYVLNNRLGQIVVAGYECSPGYRVVFYNHIDKYLYASEFPDTNSPNGHYGLIHNDYEPLCLYADDMRYYLVNLVNVVTAWNEEQQLNHKVLSFIMYVAFNNTLLWGTYSNVECTFVGLDD
jgi:hypothetical protein